MGILDEAIREHLDLKRRRGATESELQQLEDEAFGPPSRPGEPDFPERAPEGGDGPVAEAVEPEAATTFMAEAPPAEAEPETGPDAVEAVPPAEEGVLAEPAAPEPAAEEHALIEEELPGVGEPPSEELPALDEPAPAPEGTTLYDHGGEKLGFEELDLDVEQDDEAPPSPAGDEAAAHDVPIESLDTVEHHFEGAIEEAPDVEPGHDPEGAADPDAADEHHEGDGDVLEETPEFLQDRPEDDELWFEQGEPKDFDF